MSERWPSRGWTGSSPSATGLKTVSLPRFDEPVLLRNLKRRWFLERVEHRLALRPQETNGISDRVVAVGGKLVRDADVGIHSRVGRVDDARLGAGLRNLRKHVADAVALDLTGRQGHALLGERLARVRAGGHLLVREGETLEFPEVEGRGVLVNDADEPVGEPVEPLEGLHPIEPLRRGGDEEV